MDNESHASTSDSSEPKALDAELIARLLDEAGTSWGDLRVVERTGSTNEDLESALKSGTAADRSVIVAAEQTAGRGRMGRTWQSPPGGSLAWSVVLQPPATVVGFAPLVVGLAVEQAMRELSGLQVGLKWPNDIEVSGEKLGGLLSERVDDHVIVGCGLNVGVSSREIDAPNVTSLADHGLAPSREEVLVACLAHLGRLMARWREASYSSVASGLLDDYRRNCVTIGQQVQVSLPGDRTITGLARDVDESGQLLVVDPDGLQVVSAGDVTHLR